MRGLCTIAIVCSLLLLAGCTSQQQASSNQTANPAQNYTQNYTSNYAQNYPNSTSPEIPNPPGTYKGGPISIKSDDEFTAANGVVGGSGTPADPYVIEGWTIDASSFNTSGQDVGTYGIQIFQTSKYFVIRNCHVENPGKYGVGISLFYVSNGKIENCTITNSYSGISLSGSYNILVSGNTLENCHTGIDQSTYASSNVTISNNIITDSVNGIFLHNLADCYATNNTVRNCSYGIGVTAANACTISNNIVQGNEYTGIDIDYSSWEGGDNNLISNNDVSGNGGTGIRVSGSYDNITYNTVNGNGVGIALESIGLTDISAGHNIVSNNIASNNRNNGFYVCLECTGNTVAYNTFASNNAANEYFSDKSPRSYDMYIDNKNNIFKDNAYGTIFYSRP